MAKFQSKLLLSATVLLVMFSMANLRYLLIDVLPSNALEKSNDVLTENSDYSDITGKMIIAYIPTPLFNLSQYCMIKSWNKSILIGYEEDGTAPCDQIAMESRMTCDNGKCLHINYVCDNVNHCGDDSDEKDCGKYNF